MSATSQTTDDMVKHLGDPLIVAIGISDYLDNANLIGIPRDYCNVISTFNYKRGHDILYLTKSNSNKLTFVNQQISHTSLINNTFKTKWTKEEICAFNDKIVQFLKMSKNNYDGLLYFIACYGNSSKNEIFDSNGNKILLSSIIDKFNNKNCPQLAGKPKIFFGDFCTDTIEKDEEKKQVKTDGDIGKIYSNTVGNRVYGGDMKGGYLIRYFCQLLNNSDVFKNYELNEQIRLTFERQKIASDSNSCTCWSALPYRVKLLENKKIEKKGFIDTLTERTTGKEAFPSTNPLIAMIGIGKYDSNKNKSLNDIRKAVYYNYKNVKIAFNCVKGYSMIYCVNEKQKQKQKQKQQKQETEEKQQQEANKDEQGLSIELRLLTEQCDLEKTQRTKYGTNWKLEWTDDQIDEFCDFIVKAVLNKKYTNFDYNGLIFVISCHGSNNGEEDIIYDSFGNEYAIDNIFDRFNNINCDYLASYPKIFILDFERGKGKSINIDDINDNDNESKQDMKNDDSNNNNDNNNNNKNKNSLFTKHFRKIYATEKGCNFAPYDAKNGTSLIYSVCNAVKQLKNENLHDIVSDTQQNMKNSHKQQIVDDDEMPYPVVLRTKPKNLK